MKRCPTCKRSFDDDTLSFCLEDGSPLVAEAPSRPDSQETLVSPRMPGIADSGLAQTQLYNQQPGQAPPGTSPYGGYGQPAASRKAWPWVVGIGGVLLLVVAAIIVLAVVLPGRLGPSANGNRPQPSPTRQDWTPSPTPSASPSNDVPTDSDEVQDQLTKLEKEWTEANIKGDKAALEKILADEYVGNDEDSSTKRKYIDSLKPDDTVEQWEISDISVAQTGERAVVSAHLKQETTEGTENYDFIDTFVWRDHRWQAVSSHTTRVK
jgi:hypothetical protein